MPPKSRFKRPLVAVLVSSMCVAQVASAVPSDPMTTALPARDTTAPERRATADPKIEAKVGAVKYQVPIDVPKGRRDLAPDLALTYSSSASLRGGLAVGWQLDGISMIVRDPEVLDAVAYRVEGGPRLVRVLGDGPDLNYRAEYDSNFDRYRYLPMTTEWQVASLAGRVRTYRQLVSGRWYLTKDTDQFGNTIEYTYTVVTALAQTTPAQEYRDAVPSSISYTGNAAQALSPHAKVDFDYAPASLCGGVPIGAAISNRFGASLMTGSRQLAKIRISVRDTQTSSWRTSREYALGYDATEATCARSGLRYLTSVTESAYSALGLVTVVPPVTFGYGEKERTLDRVINLAGFGGGERGTNHGPTSRLLDWNGDGWVDRLTMGNTATRCQLSVYRGTGTGQFDPTPTVIDMPSASPSRALGTSSFEGCTLEGERVANGACDRAIVSYDYVDWDGDNQIDIISSLRGDPVQAGGDFGIGVIGKQILPNPAEICPRELENAGMCALLMFPQPTACPALPGQQQDGDRFRMYLQRNLGSSTVAPFSAAVRIASPTSMRGIPSSPLEIEGEVLRPDVPSFLDVNGDGLPDAVALKNPPNAMTYQQGFPPDQPQFEPPRSLGQWPTLYVWPGTGTGTFGAMQQWPLPTYSQNMIGIGWDVTHRVISLPSTVTFRDFDADGLPDIIANILPGNEVAVLYNTGSSFLAPRRLGVSIAVDMAREEIPTTTIPVMAQSGVRSRVVQVADVDADGYPEILVMPTDTNSEAPALNRTTYRFGGAWTGWGSLAAAWEPLESIVVLENYLWYRKSDAIDVTGDGRVDMVTWSPAGGAVVTTDQPSSAPARTLTSIDNGRGGRTTFEYGRSTSTDLVDLGGRQLPPSKFVRRVTKTAPGAAPMVTTYKYAGPRLGYSSPRALGAPQFLGFESVTVDTSGELGDDSARTTSTYSYAPIGYDWRGSETSRLELVKLPDGSRVPVTHTEYANQNLIVQSGVGTPPSATVPLRVTTRRCAPGETAATCATSLHSMSSTTETWRPYQSGGNVLHHQHATTRSSGSDVGATRISSRQYVVAPVNGVLRQELTESTEADEAALPALLSRQVRQFDAQMVPSATLDYADATRVSTTLHGFDAVGNERWTIRPTEVELWTFYQTWTQYDANRVYPSGTTNELGHTVTTVHDVATGSVSQSTGPNPDDYTTIINDGLGRQLAVWRISEPGAVLRKIESSEYNDVAGTLTNHRIVDHDSNLEVVTVTETDGLGRVIRRTEDADGVAAVTSFEYDAGGYLRRMETPDPSGAPKPAIYRWSHDGLGRATSFERPDGGGDDIAYRGAETVVTDRYHNTSKTFRSDARGLLRSILEPMAVRPTTYDYDALGRFAHVIDADGFVTTLRHDMQGNRTMIERGSRSWINGYDAGGRLVGRQGPTPAGGIAADYTTTYRYDQVDRIQLITPAVRNSTSSERSRLGIGATEFRYDSQRIGKLATTILPFGRIDYVVDVDGKVAHETRTIAVPGTMMPIVQSVDRRHNALGAPTSVRWDDELAWVTAYDARAKVRSVSWRDSDTAALQTLATYDRNEAGFPYQRTGLDQVREWKHDALGRTVYDRIYNTSGDTLAERSYGYAGSELSEVWGAIGDVVADASYTYDANNRLTHAIGPGDYRADLSYTDGGNIRSARIAGTAASRDVTYSYASFDPQAVEALVDSDGDFARLTYDISGNVAARDLRDGGILHLTWDGEDRLREASTSAGTEAYLFGPNAERMVAFTTKDIKVWFGDSETHYDRSGVQKKRYHHLAAGEPVARIQDSRDVELQYADAQANLMLTVGSGEPTAWFMYGAFGEVLDHDDRSEQRRQFNGKEEDVVSGLRHYGYRSYDPLTLRWASADPQYRFAPDSAWAEPQRANLYAFSLNNPITYVDPDGRDPHNDTGRAITKLSVELVIAGATGGLPGVAGAAAANIVNSLLDIDAANEAIAESEAATAAANAAAEESRQQTEETEAATEAMWEAVAAEARAQTERMEKQRQEQQVKDAQRAADEKRKKDESSKKKPATPTKPIAPPKPTAPPKPVEPVAPKPVDKPSDQAPV